MLQRPFPHVMATFLTVSGLLLLIGQVVLSGVDRLGPALRYGLLGPGSVQKATDQLEHEVAAIRDAIEAHSTAPGASSAAGGKPEFSWPTPGFQEITSPWGPRSHPILGTPKIHNGIDIAAPTGAPVEAALSGEVIMSAAFTAYGNVLVVDHGGGWATVYAHLSSVGVSEGERVEAGQVIGAVGATGRVTGPHLHFEIYQGGQSVDPMNRTYLAPNPTSPTPSRISSPPSHDVAETGSPRRARAATIPST